MSSVQWKFESICAITQHEEIVWALSGHGQYHLNPELHTMSLVSKCCNNPKHHASQFRTSVWFCNSRYMCSSKHIHITTTIPIHLGTMCIYLHWVSDYLDTFKKLKCQSILPQTSLWQHQGMSEVQREAFVFHHITLLLLWRRVHFMMLITLCTPTDECLSCSS